MNAMVQCPIWQGCRLAQQSWHHPPCVNTRFLLVDGVDDAGKQKPDAVMKTAAD